MNLNQNKSFWLLAFLFLTFGLAFNSCKQEDALSSNSDWNRPLSSEVLEAKAWFDKKSVSNIKPIWQLAKVEGNIVEIPIELDGQFHIPSLKQDKVVFGKQRLYFVKSGNSSGGSIVNFLPLSEFKGRIKDVSILNYRKHGFSGLVVVKDLNNNFLRGVHCDNGHFVSRIIQKKIIEGQLNTRGDCHWGEELYACGSVCVSGACGEPQCSSRDTYTCTDPDPDPNPDPDPCADGSCNNNDCPFGICDDGGNGGDGSTNNDPPGPSQAFKNAITAQIPTINKANFRCDQFAKDLKNVLTNNSSLSNERANAKFYKLSVTTSSNAIGYNGVGNISINRYHVFCVISGYVFDNNNPLGIPQSQFFNNLYSSVGNYPSGFGSQTLHNP
jgi:hypothetical protein